MSMDILLAWLAVIAWGLLVLTLPGTLYLTVLSICGLLPPRTDAGHSLAGPIALVIPAHDEAALITQTLQPLLTLARQDGLCDVIVIADNCSDDTACLARHAGARVIERTDPERRGKGYALDLAFSLLLGEHYTAFAVIDADSSITPDLLPALRKALGQAAAVQARYTVRNGSDNARTRLAEIAFAGFNVLRPRGRARLGCSAGILGNGFALRRETLLQVPYQATSVVEDLEYHLRLIDAGYKVGFVDDGCVMGDMPTGQTGATTQHARWQGGRLRLLREQGRYLLGKLVQGQLRYLEPLADLLLLPLAYHLVLLLATLALALLSGNTTILLLAIISLILTALHLPCALRVAHLPWQHLLALWQTPAYLIWKLRLVTTTLASAQRDSRWIRTNRDGK